MQVEKWFCLRVRQFLWLEHHNAVAIWWWNTKTLVSMFHSSSWSSSQLE